MIVASLIEKAINCVIAFVSDELSKIYNTLLAVLGLLSVVLTPIAVVCFLPDSLIFAVIATTAGVMTGTVILMSGYAKILKNRVVEIKEKFDADAENLCIEVKRLREFDSARSDTIINSISASPVNITLHEKLDYDLCKYFKYDIPESKTIIPVVFHRPSRTFFHGLYSCVGTRYFGTDWSKLKVAILPDTKTEKAKIIIYGNLNNFSAKGNDSREKWMFARIEKYVYRRDTDLEKNPLPDPEDIKIDEISDNDQSLKNMKEMFEEKVRNSLSYIDELEKGVGKLTKEYIRTLLRPLSTVLNMDVEFNESDCGDNPNAIDFNEAIKRLNSIFRLRYNHLGQETERIIKKLSEYN